MMGDRVNGGRSLILSGNTSHKNLTGVMVAGRIQVITSSSISALEKSQKIIESISTNPINTYAQVRPNPTPANVDDAFSEIRNFDPRVIVAIGGGSVIDFAKVISARLANSEISTTNELISGRTFKAKSVQLVAIPTTCGTGSEVTPFATLWLETGIGKTSIESDELIPDIAILDGELSKSASPDQLLFSGLDAISHCVETLWNRHRTSQSEMYAIQGLTEILGSFPRILSGIGTDIDYQTMQVAAMHGGLAISKNHTALAHAMSYPLTAYFGMPHGLACSFTIPAIWEMYREHFGDRAEVGKLIMKTCDLLREVELSKRINRWVNLVEARKLTYLMINSSRSGNFICDIEISDVENILNKSFA